MIQGTGFGRLEGVRHIIAVLLKACDNVFVPCNLPAGISHKSV